MDAAAERYLAQLHLERGTLPPCDVDFSDSDIEEAFNAGAAAEREACAAALEKIDRDGLEWVRDSLWADIWRRGVAAIRARGAGR